MHGEITKISSQDVEKKMIFLRGVHVLLDRDVALLYGVETKRVNEAVRNNPEKFPTGYVFSLQPAENQYVVENFDRFSSLKHSTVNPTAFTERGLYMLATILKSPQAVSTTIAIIDTFTSVREMARTMEALQSVADGGEQQKSLFTKKWRTHGWNRWRLFKYSNYRDGNRVELCGCENKA